MINLKFLLKNKQMKNLLIISCVNMSVVTALFAVCRSSSSLVLTAFTYLIIFDLSSVLTALLSIWIKFQVASGTFSYGFKRCEVLAIFSCAILQILGSFFIIKESVETFFEDKEIHTDYLFPTCIVAFIFHLFITVSVKNEPFDYVVKSSSSSWLQEHMLDISESACRYIPGLSKVLLPRVNPFILIGFANLFTSIGSYFLLEIGYTYLIDSYAAILIAIMTVGTMLPFVVFTGKILMQTTPPHLLTQLDKSLREASTLDGVLEFREEHFWTLSFGVLVGSLHVRIRRDADEQLVLAHVWNKLAGIVQVLTIQIFKDDWMRRTTHQLVYNQHSFNFQIAPPAPPLAKLPPLISENTNNLVNFTSSSATSNTAPLSTSSTTAATRKSAINNNSIVDNDFVIVNP